MFTSFSKKCVLLDQVKLVRIEDSLFALLRDCLINKPYILEFILVFGTKFFYTYIYTHYRIPDFRFGLYLEHICLRIFGPISAQFGSYKINAKMFEPKNLHFKATSFVSNCINGFLKASVFQVFRLTNYHFEVLFCCCCVCQSRF